LIWLFISMFTR